MKHRDINNLLDTENNSKVQQVHIIIEQFKNSQSGIYEFFERGLESQGELIFSLLTSGG